MKSVPFISSHTHTNKSTSTRTNARKIALDWNLNCFGLHYFGQNDHKCWSSQTCAFATFTIYFRCLGHRFSRSNFPNQWMNPENTQTEARRQKERERTKTKEREEGDWQKVHRMCYGIGNECRTSPYAIEIFCFRFTVSRQYQLNSLEMSPSKSEQTKKNTFQHSHNSFAVYSSYLPCVPIRSVETKLNWIFIVFNIDIAHNNNNYDILWW